MNKIKSSHSQFKEAYQNNKDIIESKRMGKMRKILKKSLVSFTIIKPNKLSDTKLYE